MFQIRFLIESQFNRQCDFIPGRLEFLFGMIFSENRPPFFRIML